jgi:preprotein translocase subunit SecE
VLLRLAGMVAYIRDVRVEVRKVTWPGWEDLRRSTFVIIVVVILIGIVIGVMDLIFSRVFINFLPRLFA